MPRFWFPLLLLLVLVQAAAAVESPRAPAMAPGAFADYVEDGRSGLHHAADTLPRFDALMASLREAGLASLTTEALHQLAWDAHVANFYYAGARPDAHRDVVDELLRRSAATDDELGDFHDALVAARRWDEARAFALRFPDLPLDPVPVIEDRVTEGEAPAYMRVEAATGTLLRETFDPGQGPMLLVISHPGCAFSRRAMAAIAADPALNQALPTRRLFLAPTFGGLKLDWVTQWNADQPDFPHVLVDQPARWPQVPSWGTPSFLFLVDGELVETVTGWPGDEQAEALMAAAQRAADAAN